MKKKLVNTSAILVLGLVFSCSKNTSNSDKVADSAKNQSVPQSDSASDQAVVVLKNPNKLSLSKISDDVYHVDFPAKSLKTLPTSKNPYKKTCQTITDLKKELNHLVVIKADLVSKVESDNSFEASIDDVQLQIDNINSKIDELTQSSDLSLQVVYSKEDFLNKLDVLKTENSSAVFKLKQPEKLVLNLTDENGEVVAIQNLDPQTSLTEGAYDETPSDLKLNLKVNYEVLCSQRDLILSKSGLNKTQLVLSFK